MLEIKSYIIEKLKIDKSVRTNPVYSINDYKPDDVCLLIKYNYKKFYCTIKVIKLIKIITQSNYITFYYKSEVTDKFIRGDAKFESPKKYKYPFAMRSGEDFQAVLIHPDNVIEVLKGISKNHCKLNWKNLISDGIDDGKYLDIRKSQINTDFIHYSDIQSFIHEVDEFKRN